MKAKANKALIASILTGLVFLFGCGGGGSTSSTSSTPNQVAPTITSASSAIFNEGSAGSFTVTATGTPTTTITESGALPPGVTFSAGILSGTPTASGSFPITITASNSVSPNAVQSFTLTVNASSSSSALTSNISALAFSGAAGGSNPTGQSITISSTTGSQLTVSAAATTTDGANWLLLNLPGNMTTPITLPVSADIIDTGMGASTFTGAITLIAAGSSAPPLVVNVSLSLAPSQPPYFTGSYPYSLPPQGPASVTMPDGTVVTQGSNQLLVFVSQGATPAQMTGIGSVLNSAGASAVGEIQYGNILEVQVPNVGVVPALMSKLLVTPGVVDVEPYIFTQRGQASCLNTQPGSWLTADNLPPAAPPSNGVTILVADCFNASLCPEGLTNSTTGLPISHGDAVARFLKGTTQGSFTIMTCDDSDSKGNPDFGLTQKCIQKAAKGLTSGQKLVVNLSDVAPYSVNPTANSINELRLTNEFNSYALQLHNTFAAGQGPDVLIVKAGGNSKAPVNIAPSALSCNFVSVGATDTESSTAAALNSLSDSGSALSVYAPGCAVNPDPTTLNGTVSGTSFSAPQAAGVLATLLADNPTASSCKVASTLASLPTVSGIPLLNGTAMTTTLTSPPAQASPPSLPFGGAACPYITVLQGSTLTMDTTVNKTASVGEVSITLGSGTLTYLSTNPLVATVDDTGDITALGTGTTSIVVSSSGVTCQAIITVIVNSAETYAGTYSINTTDGGPIPNCTPDPFNSTTSQSGTVQLAVSPSLLKAGAFNGGVTLGAGTLTLTVPSETCTNPDGSITTVPGSTVSAPVPAISGTITGTTDGSVIAIPVPGLPSITGTVTAAGSLNLSWNFTQSGSGVTDNIQISMSLTKQ